VVGGMESIDFHFQMMPCRFNLNLPLFDLGPSHLKARGPIYSFSANRIALIHWTLDLGPSSKVALTLRTKACMHAILEAM
jgi:hypothetical protein